MREERLSLGGNTRAVTRPGVLQAEIFASAAASFGGKLAHFRAKRGCSHSQIEWICPVGQVRHQGSTPPEDRR